MDITTTSSRIVEKIVLTQSLETLVQQFHDELVENDIVTIVDEWISFPIIETENSANNLKKILRIILFDPIELSINGSFLSFFDNQPKLKISVTLLSTRIQDFLQNFVKYHGVFFRDLSQRGFDDPAFSHFYFNHKLNSLKIRDRMVFIIVKRFINYPQSEFWIGAKGIGDILRSICGECLNEHADWIHKSSNHSPLVPRKRTDREKSVWNQQFAHADHVLQQSTLPEVRQIHMEDDDDEEGDRDVQRLKASQIIYEKRRLNEEESDRVRKIEEMEREEERRFQYEPKPLLQKIIKLVTTIESVNGIQCTRDMFLSTVDTVLFSFLKDSGTNHHALTYQ